MKIVRINRWLASLLALTLTSSAFADSVRVKGPPHLGHARPPLYLNLTPASSVYYSPGQIRHAYGFDQLSATGAGQKIAIVDAYGNANIQNDLNTFCAQFGLNSATVQIIGNNTGVDPGWAMETALDVEWAHAIAPGATIILSVASSSQLTDLLNAVDAAVNAGATVVSMSWGTTEFSGMPYYDGHFNRANVSFTASSGDGGAGVEWPAVSPYILAVGGTSLYLDANGNRSSETGWSGSGGGPSAYYSIPSYQNGWATSGTRGVPDVSFVADPATGVLVYDLVNGGWLVVGGTSAGAPQWAGLIALVNDARARNGFSALGLPHTRIYPLAQASATTPHTVNAAYFYDVSQGNNGAYNAAAPYDFVTGLGSPVANAIVVALAGTTNQPAPVTASFTANPTSGQAPLTVQFTDQSSGSVASWSWNFGDGAASTAQNPFHAYNSARSFTAVLTVTGSNGQTSTASHTITVTNAPTQVVANFSANRTSGQAPLTVQFTDQSSGSVASWSWNFGDGAASTAQNPSHTYNSSGNFTAVLTVTGSNGQTSSASQAITVTNAPPSANGDFSISASPSSITVKAGQNGSYTVSVTPTGGYNGTIILNVSGLPLGAIPIFNPSLLIGSGSSTLTIWTSLLTPRSNSTLTITGTGISVNGTQTHSTTVSLKIR